MADIFLSYARADEERAERVRAGLAAADYEVIWDKDLQPGTPDWDKAIRAMLDQSRCVVVLWSTMSIESNAVRQEAALAKSMNKPLLQVLVEPLEAVQLPMGLFHEQAADLSGWAGDRNDAAFKKLVSALQGILGIGTHSVRQRAQAEERLSSLQVEADTYRRQIAELSARLRTSQGERDSAVAERAGLQSAIQALTGERDAAEQRIRAAEQERDAARKQEQAMRSRQVSAGERPVGQRAGFGFWGVSLIALATAAIGFWGGAVGLGNRAFELVSRQADNPSTMSAPSPPRSELVRRAAVVPILDGADVNEATVPGTVFRDCEYCPEMVVVRIAGINFETGHPRDSASGTRAFAVSRFEISVGEYRAYSPRYARAALTGDREEQCDELSRTSNFPAVCLGDELPAAYATWLSAQTNELYRIPSWAQSDALITSSGVRAASSSEICEYANLRDRDTGQRGANIACRDGALAHAPVGSYLADQNGLHDVVGNVAEHVTDARNQIDYRGGSYGSPRTLEETPAFVGHGFRLIRRLAPPPAPAATK